MKKAFLHIGPYKTGSSYLQRFFASNVEWLRTNNIHYPQTHVTALERDGGIHSGNGFGIFQCLNIDEYAGAERQLSAILSAEQEVVLLSCEQLCDLKTRHFQFLESTSAQHERELSVILYVRPPIDIVLSTLNQWVKRHGLTIHPRDCLFEHIGQLKQLVPWSAIKEKLLFLEETFPPDRLNIINYQKHLPTGIERPLLQTIGIRDTSGMHCVNAIVNPSLSEGETLLMLEINKKTRNMKLFEVISDMILKSQENNSDNEGKILYPLEKIELAAVEFNEDITYIESKIGEKFLAYSDDLIGKSPPLTPEKCAQIGANCLLELLKHFEQHG